MNNQKECVFSFNIEEEQVFTVVNIMSESMCVSHLDQGGVQFFSGDDGYVTLSCLLTGEGFDGITFEICKSDDECYVLIGTNEIFKTARELYEELKEKLKED